MKSHLTFWAVVVAVFFSQHLSAAEQQGVPRQQGLPVKFTMPQPGRVTIAINDSSGIRARNLIADVEKPKGSHTVYWDGLDDDGRVLPAGTYEWIGLTRGDLHAVYRGTFTHGNPPWIHGTTGGWAADHGSPVAAACIGERIFLGTGIAEGGHGLICCDLEGNKLWGERWLNRTVWSGANSLAADGERLFATSRPWQEQRIWEVDPETGKSWWVFSFPRDGLPEPIGKIGGIYLAGARKTGPTRWDGELYASDVCGDAPRTFVFSTARNPETDSPTGYDDAHGMKLLRVLPVRIWGMTWLTDGRCVAALDKSIAFIDTQTGKTTPITDAVEAPVAITSDGRNRLYVSDWGGQIWGTFPKSSFKIIGLRNSEKASIQVKIFDTWGKLLRAMGRPGGQPIGAVDPNSFFMPQQLAIDPRGRLWVTEFRLTPKRVSVWEIPDDPAKAAPKLVRELFGPPAYGEGAFMEDPKNPQLITDGEYGVTWEVDLAAGTYAPVSAAWRDFSICWENPENRPGLPFGGMPKKTFIYEGRTYQMLFSGVIGEKRNGRFVPLAAFGTVHDLIFYRWSVQEQWLPKQVLDAAKKHPRWAELAKKNGLDPEMEDFPHIKEYSVDSRPTWPIELMAFNWTDSPGPNGTGDGEWQADEIKLSPRQPAPGGVLCFGSNLDLLVEVGACLWRMKREGFNKAGAPIYDWAKAEQISKGRIGIAAHVAPDGSMLTADTEVVRLIGPDGVQRWSYPTPLSNGHGWRDMANAKGGGRPLHKTWVGSTGAGAVDAASALDMHPELWAAFVLRPEGYQSAPDVLRMKPAAKDRPLPVLESQARHPADPARYAEAVTWVTRTHEDLLLKWYVAKDTSPFANNGKDWTSLFKTGDACDLQIASPTLGACRYLITMFDGQPAVVRFRYDAKDATAEQGLTYKSPVGQVLVPVVERLPIEPKVERGADWYAVQVAIPWKVLGIVPKGGTKIPAELGVLRSDPAGTQTVRRDYWHSGLSGMLNDVPTEVKPTANWGVLSID